MTPESMTDVLSHLGVSAIFVLAWFRSENLRDRERKEFDSRTEKLHSRLEETQTTHRREMLELLQRFIPRRNPTEFFHDET